MAAGLDLSSVYLSWTRFTEQFLDPNTGITTLNVLMVPMGGNAEGMGTAFTAVSDDAGYIESNPAASSRLESTEISLAHRDWIDDVSVDRVVYTMRFGNLGLGLAGKFLPIRFARSDNWGNQTGKGYVAESVVTVNASYNFFDTYEFDGIAVGASFKLAYRGVSGALVPDFETQSAVGIMGDFGVLTRFNLLKTYVSRTKNFSVGAALKNLGPDVMDEPLPTVLSLGVAYSPVRPLLFSLDINVPLSLDPEHFPAERINLATGVDIRVAEFLSLQGGVWLRGGNPRVTLGATAELSPMSIVVNSSLDLTRQATVVDKLSVEARINLGDRGRAAVQTRIDEAFARALDAYAEGDLETTVELSREVLSLRRDHFHAQRLARLAEESLETRRRIREKQEEAAGLMKSTAGDTRLNTEDEGLKN
jgi:hypothetical protein